MSISALYKLHY